MQDNDTIEDPNIKVAHLEIDYNEPRVKWQSFFEIFTPKSSNFLLGMKMRLVSETASLTTAKARLKAVKLQNLQAQFLTQSDTCYL